MSSATLSWSSAASTMPGETESGDRGLVCPVPEGLLLAAIDGLGHGVDAAQAARVAAEILERYAGEPVIALFKRCHDALLSTRGAAMSLALINTVCGTLTWLGVGNVEGVVMRADPGLPNERLLLRSGVVGYQLPQLQTAVVTLNPGDTLIFTTDGLLHGFEQMVNTDAPLKVVAERILSAANKGIDDALVLVARYGGIDS